MLKLVRKLSREEIDMLTRYNDQKVRRRLEENRLRRAEARAFSRGGKRLARAA